MNKSKTRKAWEQLQRAKQNYNDFWGTTEDKMVIVTDHALQRARERCGIQKHTVLQQAERAFNDGIERAKTVGTLRRYLDWLLDQEERRREANGVNSIMVYGNFIWLFDHDRLVTVLDLPSHLRNSADSQIKRNNGETKRKYS